MLSTQPADCIVSVTMVQYFCVQSPITARQSSRNQRTVAKCSQKFHSKMHKVIIILIWPIFFANCGRWYPATLFDIDGLRNDILQKEKKLKTNYIMQDEEHKYIPLSIVRETQKQLQDKDTWRSKNASIKPSIELKQNFSKSYIFHPITEAISISNNNAAESDTISITNVKVDSNKSPKIPTIHYNNTIKNIKFVNREHPRRKISRRCPSISRRQKKQLNLNATAESRFLGVFEIVEFEHTPCTSSSGLDGTCLPEHRCRAIGGLNMGTCADGYGTCCVVQFSCDDHSAAVTGWFTNPGFPLPSAERLSCSLTLNKASEHITQIRLDLNSFELLPPTTGTCEQDQFVVSGQNINNVIPILCGVNTGQHVYIEVDDVDGPLYLTVQTISADTRLFSIKVTQLTKTDELAAPAGCLQYFKEPQGYLESFNYRDKSDITIARIPSYLNNLNYAMCIERATESCSITYNNMGALQIVNYDTDGLPVIPPQQAGVEIFNCPSDWLLIASTRLCGERLNDGTVLQDFAYDAPITDTAAGPIMILFRTDGAYIGRGFKLEYQQNKCVSTA